MSSCKHLRIESENLPTLGGSEPILEHICILKRQSAMKRLEVYQKLFEKRLEGSMVTNNCPVATRNLWASCPYYEPIKK